MIKGKTPELVLSRSVIKNITSKRKDTSHARIGSDASSIKAGGQIVVYKTSGAVDYTDIDKNYYTFYKVYNSMIAEGAIPSAMELNILLPMDAKEKDIKAIVKEYDDLCKKHDMEITGGNTQVTDVVNGVVTTVTMIGFANEEKKTYADRMKQQACVEESGETDISIIMTKAIGIEGTAIIASTHENMLRERFNGRFCDECLRFKDYINVEKEARVLIDLKDIVMHDVSATGVNGAIWELAAFFGMGVRADLKSIPVWQETIEVTELFDINPYKMASSGAMLIATRTPELILEKLEAVDIPAVVIGKLMTSNDRVLINNDEVRYLEQPRGDDIYQMENDSHFKRKQR